MSEPRLGYDGDEGIWFDRTKPAGSDYRGPLYEECDPEEVCDELEAQLAKAQAALVTYYELHYRRMYELDFDIERPEDARECPCSACKEYRALSPAVELTPEQQDAYLDIVEQDSTPVVLSPKKAKS